jgi:hypothetical protein
VASMMLHTSCFKNAAALLVAMLVLLARPGRAQLVMCDPRGPDHLDACPGGLAYPDCKQAFCPCPCPMKFLSIACTCGATNCVGEVRGWRQLTYAQGAQRRDWCQQWLLEATPLSTCSAAAEARSTDITCFERTGFCVLRAGLLSC